MITFLALFLFCDCSHAWSSTLFFIKGMFFEQLKASVEKCFSWHSLKWGPRTWDPEPEIWNPGPQDRGPRNRESELRAQDAKTWEPETLNFFIDLQNKTLKNKKWLTMPKKHDNAKYPFTYFSPIKIFGFFFSS